MLPFIDKGKTSEGASLGEELRSSVFGILLVSVRCLVGGQMEHLSSQVDMQSGEVGLEIQIWKLSMYK